MGAGDIIGKAAYSKISNFNKLNGKKIVCLGDSITGDYLYPTKLGTILGATTYNCGFGGTRWIGGAADYTNFSMYQIANAIATSTWTVPDSSIGAIPGFATNYARLKAIDFSTIDYIVIFIGTNDFAGGTHIGHKDDTYAQGTVRGAINSVISLLTTAYPQIKLYVVSPPWRQRITLGDNRDSDNHTNNGKYLLEYVDAMIERCNAHHIPIFDMYRNCNINVYNHATYLDDGLHPVEGAGTTLLAEKIAGFLAYGQGSTMNTKTYRSRTIEFFDDFLYSTLTASTAYSLVKGSDGSAVAPAISANDKQGIVKFVTGAAGTGAAADVSQFSLYTFPIATFGDVVFETRFRIATSIANARVCIGVTDQRTSAEEPWLVFGGSCTFQDTGDTATDNSHGLSNGDKVTFPTVVTTTGITANTPYFVVNSAANTFQVSLTSGGAAIQLTTDGSGTYNAIRSIADDSACLVYDSNATTKQWFACSVDSTVQDTGNAPTGVAPTADVWQTFRIEISVDAGTIRFYIDNELVKTLTDAAISSNTALYGAITVGTNTTASQTAYADYVYYSYDRSL